MSVLDRFPSPLFVLSQATGLGFLLYGMATGASALVAIGVIVTGVSAASASKGRDSAEA